MAYVPVPKDLSKIKPKVMFGLTKRQLVCFGAGVAVGLPLFFLLRAFASISAAALVMILSMLPFFLLGMYEKDGQPLEAVLKNVLHTLFLTPKQRPYRTDNFYAALEQQYALDKEVQAIVRKTRSAGKKASGAKTDTGRKKATRRAGRSRAAK